MEENVDEVESAPKAIEQAFDYFRRFYETRSYSHALLEGVTEGDTDWVVKIGFDIPAATTSPFGEKGEPRRVVRTFYVTKNDGSLRQVT